MIMKQNRVYWVDLCKGIGIFLVLLEHTLRNDVTMYICAFNMPMFFSLSGIVFNEIKHNDFKAFVKGRFNQLVIPYFFFYLLTYFLWLFVERHFRSFDLDWWQPIIGMFYASQWHGFMDHNGILWFLPCLFVVEILNFWILRIRPRYIQPILLFLLLVLGFSIKTNLPWCLNTACVALPFYYLGHSLKKGLLIQSLNQDKFVNKWWVSGMLLICFSLLFFIIEGNCRNAAYMIQGVYGNPVVYEVVAISGILMMVYFGKVLSPKNELLFPALKSLLFLGKNTLVIFALHSFFLRIVRYGFESFLSITNYDTNVLTALIMDLLLLVFLCPLIPLYNNFRDRYLSKLYLS